MNLASSSYITLDRLSILFSIKIKDNPLKAPIENQYIPPETLHASDLHKDSLA